MSSGDISDRWKFNMHSYIILKINFYHFQESEKFIKNLLFITKRVVKLDTKRNKFFMLKFFDFRIRWNKKV